MTIKCIIIDDSDIALDYLTLLLKEISFLEIIGCYQNPIKALEACDTLSPDLIFSDVDMPELSGIDFAKLITGNANVKNRPLMIYTTSFETFALQAHRVDAIGYLLKPVKFDELLNVCLKAKRLIELSNAYENNLKNLTKEAEAIYVRVEFEIVRINLREIAYLESAGDYVKIHLVNSETPVKCLSTLRKLEEKLPEHLFKRIHRSYIVAHSRIEAITRKSVRISNTLIPVGEQFRGAFQHFFDQWANE
ncbi:response regulator transcription factor [Mucilaginibacter sp. 21P]|uniref:LytR/AlgR family response regulator transcription factor n=1 Tax=Mucilaginibacter sp. 21P TaxID=2778902 RepID=UPI001C5907DA|nr:LytTR family DNA-binding domain-containing protein [Mucilaginibacter sp. 21P]QXV63794.1 response regulator transcription factor [Mucilaginibacter sp. 21P]